MRREMVFCGLLLVVPAGMALFMALSGVGGASEPLVGEREAEPERSPVAESDSGSKHESPPPKRKRPLAPEEGEETIEDAAPSDSRNAAQSGSAAEARQVIHEEREQLRRRLAAADGEEREKLVRYETVLQQLEDAVSK